jgi:acyl-CoA reductase-like NAD-dependent aldehyde dehydrogenase
MEMIETSVMTYKNLINGEWVDSSSGKTFASKNPARTSDIIGIFQSSTAEDAQQAVHAAEKAFAAWAKTAPSKRAEILNKAADILESRLEKLAEELTREEGKVISSSRMEIKRSASTFRYYAVEGLSFTGETFPTDDPGSIVYTAREPLGVISVITPWNFPISIAARKIAPALITGNTVVFKPSSDTPLLGLRLVEALVEAGIPKGVINFITGSASQVVTPLLTDPAVKAVTFTGSTQAGESIHRAVSLTTRTQMELGGKNPLVIMDDADVDKAVELTIKGGFELTGQACTGTSRVIIMKSLHDAYVEKLVEKTKKLKIGNGLEQGIELGPLANEKQLKNVLHYLEIGKSEGATLVYGGEVLSGAGYDEGYFVTPAIFTDVTPDMRIAQEEIFGPVVAVIAINSLEEALKIANDVEYGLSASIVTKNIETAHTFANGIQSGTVKINRTTTGNLINAPFGGIKKSSTSTFRESGRVGLEFFTQTKTVYYGY